MSRTVPTHCDGGDAPTKPRFWLQRFTLLARASSQKVRNRVGLTGIEPALPKELDPKSSASASSATAPELAFQTCQRSVPNCTSGSSPFSNDPQTYSRASTQPTCLWLARQRLHRTGQRKQRLPKTTESTEKTTLYPPIVPAKTTQRHLEPRQNHSTKTPANKSPPRVLKASNQTQQGRIYRANRRIRTQNWILKLASRARIPEVWQHLNKKKRGQGPQGQ